MLRCASSPDWSTMRLQATGVLHSRRCAGVPGCLPARRPCWILVLVRLGSYAREETEATSGAGCKRAPMDLRAVRPLRAADGLWRLAPRRRLVVRTPLTQNAGRARTWRRCMHVDSDSDFSARSGSNKFTEVGRTFGTLKYTVQGVSAIVVCKSGPSSAAAGRWYSGEEKHIVAGPNAWQVVTCHFRVPCCALRPRPRPPCRAAMLQRRSAQPAALSDHAARPPWSSVNGAALCTGLAAVCFCMGETPKGADRTKARPPAHGTHSGSEAAQAPARASPNLAWRIQVGCRSIAN